MKGNTELLWFIKNKSGCSKHIFSDIRSVNFWARRLGTPLKKITMHEETLTQNTKRVLEALDASGIVKDFYC